MADTADYLVVKRNELNELRLLDTPLLTPELKVANALISLISPDDDELKSYRLTVSELGRLTGSNNMHRDIERISDTPRPIGRGFLDRSKNLPASTRLP